MAFAELPLEFRPGTHHDENFVFHSWLAEFRQTSFGTMIDSEVYYKHYRRHIGVIIRHSQILICCNPEDHDQIYGYIVYRLHGDVRVVSWICVKGPFRMMGIGSKLYKEAGGAEVVTHLTSRLVRPGITPAPGQIKIPRGVLYNPFLDLFLKEKETAH